MCNQANDEAEAVVEGLSDYPEDPGFEDLTGLGCCGVNPRGQHNWRCSRKPGHAGPHRAYAVHKVSSGLILTEWWD